MPKYHAMASIIAVIAALSMLLCSCAAPPAMTAEDSVKLRELADMLNADLQDEILAKRTHPDSLVDLGYVVSRKDYSLGANELALFHGDYQTKSDCEVTIVFANSSFVVTRVIFTGGKGYYLRYEYNKNDPKAFEFSGQMITDIDLQYQESPPKWTLELQNGSKRLASFKFVNPK